MRRVILYLVVGYLNVVFGQNTAKQISFRSLSVEEGLSQNSVVSIAQDSIGYLWFATQDGLNKYDGRSFKIYNKQFEDVTRPNYSKLGKVSVDIHGNVWIISKSGKLEQFNRVTKQFEAQTLIKNISTQFQAPNGDRYIGTYSNGLYFIDAVKRDTIHFLKNKTIYDVLSKESSIYVATSGGIYSLNDFKISAIKSTIEQGNYSALAFSEDKRLWVGSYGHGLFYKELYDRELKQFNGFDLKTIPSTLNIQDVLVDHNDKLWVATYGDGVYLIDFELKSIQHFKANKNNPYALHYNDVLCLYEDFTGTIWLGTDGAGLSYYDEHLAKFNVLTNNQTPSDVQVDVIRSITVKDDIYWLGTSGKGLTRINLKQDRYITYTTSNSALASNRIMSLLFTDSGLLIGHQGKGLQLLESNGDFKNYPLFKEMTIWKIIKGQQDHYWLATRDNGIIEFDLQKEIFINYTKSNSNLNTNNIRTLELDDTILWIGTADKGLFKFDLVTNNISPILEIQDPIKSLYIEAGALWIGTNGSGLKHLNIKTNKVEVFNKETGLPNNVIYGILPDNDGQLWLSSNRGITKFKREKAKNSSIENYSNYDGLQAFEFNTGAYFKDTKGNLFFGGLEGLNWFNPAQLTFNTVKPKTIISKIEMFDDEQSLSQEKVFKFNENTFTFTFSGLHFSQPERNQYKYRLVNNDEDWITSGNSNVAHYTNLPANDYEFQVVSSNYDGVWNTSPAIYKFSILKPWYATNFAKTLYIFLLFLTGFGIYKYLKFRWEVKTQLKLEHAENERLIKLDEFKTKLYTNISHEIRTPLTLISGPIEQQLDKSYLTNDDRQGLELVKLNADRLLNLANQMLDLSLVESGQMRLNVIQGDLGMLLKQLVATFQFKAKDKQINFKSNIESISKAYFDVDIIGKVMSNLLSNAIKYTPNNGEIVVDAVEKNNALVLSVINNYDKVKLKDLSRLFKRFYQEDEAAEGVGVGLALVKELINASKGSIIASNIDTDKIQFTVTLPINKEAFNVSQFDETTVMTMQNSKKDTVLVEVLSDEEVLPLLLVVEDEDDIRRFIISMFTKTHRIIEASNGEIGCKLAKEELPDAIISDIMMPVKDGIALCNDLKYDILTSHIPIILLTAKVGEEHEILGLKTGADAYITKPFNSKVLQTHVAQLIKSRKQLKEHYNNGFIINPELAITSTENEFLKRLKLVLETHITESDFTSERFSELLQMSRTQLHRKLKAITGQSTSEFIRTQRLKLAEELLRDSDANVSEIAYQVGFNSPSYFTKCFKQHFGITPNDFLNSL